MLFRSGPVEGAGPVAVEQIASLQYWDEDEHEAASTSAQESAMAVLGYVSNAIQQAVQAALEAGGAEVIDASGMIVIPGLIDSHTHMWQAPMKGIGASLWGMADYSKHVFPLREKFAAEDMHDATFACGVEMLDHGITTVLD